MARKPRLHFPGAVYHVTLRGNDRQDIFFSDDDRRRFYALLQEGVERFGHKIHAFCLMTNHCHLAIQVGEIPLSRIIQNVSFRYTVWVNKHQQRSGHLFQGRYKAILVDGDAYLLELVRYIHLNPIRAAMTTSPEEYLWSSHHAYCGAEKLSWVTTGWILSQFSEHKDVARQQYLKFIYDGLANKLFEDFYQQRPVDNRVMGDERFAAKVLKAANEHLDTKIALDQLLSVVSRYYNLTAEQLRAVGKTRKAVEARAVTALLAQEYGCSTTTELGKIFARDVTSLSSAARRLEKRIITVPEVTERVAVIRTRITKLQA